jgi:hypothetical protein
MTYKQRIKYRFEQDVTIQCDLRILGETRCKEKIDKILLDKDKEIKCLKNHSQILLMEVKKLKCKDISILKVDKETSMDASESRNFSKVETANKETSMELIVANNQSAIIDEVFINERASKK